MKQLTINTRILLLSELGIGSRGNQLLIDICKQTGGSTYLLQRPAQKYLDPHAFREAEIELKFFKPPSIIYPQLWGSFLPNLSALDLLFNCGPRSHDILDAEKDSNP